MLRRTLITIASAAALAAGIARAQQAPDFSKVEIKNEKVADNLYLLTGQGGNMALLVGNNGPLLVDDQFAPLAPKIVAAVASLSGGKPVRFLLNTHFHGDHAGGNAEFGKAGSVIIAHDNTLKRLSTEQTSGLTGTKSPPQPPEAWPVITFADAASLHVNGEDIEAVHVANAHTDTDAIIYFKKSNVVHTGDVFAGPQYPFIDAGSGGSMDGVIAALGTVLARINDDTKIIPGHAPVQKKTDLEAFRKMLMDVRERIARDIRAGKTQEQVVAANLTKEYDAKSGKGFITPTIFVQRAYVDLKRTVK
jgi:cyclase